MKNPNEKKICDIFINYCKKENYAFTFKARNITLEEVFSMTGLLPAMLKKANKLAEIAFGYDLDFSFNKTERSILGYDASFNDENNIFVILICVFDIVNEIIKDAKNTKQISLDSLNYE